jgi:acetylornithine/succinyldiaminopimelate/putrescine aminotransferase
VVSELAVGQSGRSRSSAPRRSSSRSGSRWDGYPVAAVIARQELFDRLKAETEVFSTFGVNPVAARAVVAVLDVIEDERLIENAKRVGEELRSALAALNLGEVRGRGLLIGVELESAELAEDVVNRMRDAGILINRTCPRERPEDPPATLLHERVHESACQRARDGGCRFGQLEAGRLSPQGRLQCPVVPVY